MCFEAVAIYVHVERCTDANDTTDALSSCILLYLKVVQL